MAFPVVNNPQSANGTSSTLTITGYAVGAEGNRVLLVWVGTTNGSSTARTVASVVWNGHNLTNIPGSTGTANSGTTRVHGSWWYLDNPENTTSNIVITLSGSPSEVNAMALYLSGANTGGPEVTAGAADGSSPVQSSLTTGQAESIHMSAGSAQNDGAGYSPQAGTTEDDEQDGTVANSVFWGHKNQASAGAASTNGWTTSELNTSWMASATWHPPAGGGGGLSIPVAQAHYRQMKAA